MNGNKGREQRKESNYISWNLTVFYQQNKTAAICCQASKAVFALLALPFVFWHLFCCSWGSHAVASLTVPILCLSSKVSYIELSVTSVSSIQICSVFNTQVQRFYWSNFWWKKWPGILNLESKTKKNKRKQKCIKIVLSL